MHKFDSHSTNSSAVQGPLGRPVSQRVSVVSARATDFEYGRPVPGQSEISVTLLSLRKLGFEAPTLLAYGILSFIFVGGIVLSVLNYGAPHPTFEGAIL